MNTSLCQYLAKLMKKSNEKKNRSFAHLFDQFRPSLQEDPRSWKMGQDFRLGLAVHPNLVHLIVIIMLLLATELSY